MRINSINICIFFLCCFLSFNLKAQEEIVISKRKITHEIGVNASYILTQLVGVKQDSINKSPFLVSYRMGLGNWGIHFGIGGNYKTSESSEPGFADKRTKTTYALDLRVGLNYRVQFSKRFTGLFGMDLLKRSRFSDDIDDSGFDKIEVLNQYHAYGFGPSVGIEFWFNKHMTISTEAMFYVYFGNIDNGRSFENFPELNDNVVHLHEVEVVTILPASIFFKYQF